MRLLQCQADFTSTEWSEQHRYTKSGWKDRNHIRAVRNLHLVFLFYVTITEKYIFAHNPEKDHTKTQLWLAFGLNASL